MKVTAKGFTLIELLIVISILGILAVAVLSAINPIEQINRGKDTGNQSDAEQLLGAIDRYYATQGFYPWQTAPLATDAEGFGVVDMAWVDNSAGSGQAVLTKLSAGGTGEIKASFVNRITATGYVGLYKYNKGSQGDSTYVCFLPQSNSFEVKAQDRCAGTLPGDYPPNGTSLTTGVCPGGAAACKTANTCKYCLP